MPRVKKIRTVSDIQADIVRLEGVLSNFLTAVDKCRADLDALKDESAKRSAALLPSKGDHRIVRVKGREIDVIVGDFRESADGVPENHEYAVYVSKPDGFGSDCHIIKGADIVGTPAKGNDDADVE